MAFHPDMLIEQFKTATRNYVGGNDILEMDIGSFSHAIKALMFAVEDFF